MIRIACIGSRQTSAPVLAWMEEMGAKLVGAGYILLSGNAPGADQAWARGGNKVNARHVELFLPWEYFESSAIDGRNPIRVIRAADATHMRFYEVVKQTHPKWADLTAAGLQLHARNAMLVDMAHIVLGSLNPDKPGGGGTGSAFRMAQRRQIPTFNVADALTREMISERIMMGQDPRGKIYDTGKGKKW